MSHKSSVRLSDEAWAGLEQALAAQNITQTAFFETCALAFAAASECNEMRPGATWGTVDASWPEFFEKAQAIDRARRARRPLPDG